MRRAWRNGIAAVVLLAACSGDGCGCRFANGSGASCGPIDIGGPDTCTPAGGWCEGPCEPETSHLVSTLRCPGAFLPQCCVTGATCEARNGTCLAGSCAGAGPHEGYCPAGYSCCASLDDSGSDAPADGPRPHGTCDGVPCFAGCACEPGAAEAGAMGVCVCGGDDAGTDAGADAASDADSASDAPSDAVDDAPLDSSIDAPAEAEAGATSEACGLITCRGGCVCVSVALSECVCP